MEKEFLTQEDKTFLVQTCKETVFGISQIEIAAKSDLVTYRLTRGATANDLSNRTNSEAITRDEAIRLIGRDEYLSSLRLAIILKATAGHTTLDGKNFVEIDPVRLFQQPPSVDSDIEGIALELLSACGEDYRRGIWEAIKDDVIQDVKDCSGLSEGDDFNEDDVRLAIGRTLYARLGINDNEF